VYPRLRSRKVCILRSRIARLLWCVALAGLPSSPCRLLCTSVRRGLWRPPVTRRASPTRLLRLQVYCRSVGTFMPGCRECSWWCDRPSSSTVRMSCSCWRGAAAAAAFCCVAEYRDTLRASSLGGLPGRCVLVNRLDSFRRPWRLTLCFLSCGRCGYRRLFVCEHSCRRYRRCSLVNFSPVYCGEILFGLCASVSAQTVCKQCQPLLACSRVCPARLARVGVLFAVVNAWFPTGGGLSSSPMGARPAGLHGENPHPACVFLLTFTRTILAGEVDLTGLSKLNFAHEIFVKVPIHGMVMSTHVLMSTIIVVGAVHDS